MKVPDIIKEVARSLRKNMTPSEKFLWKELSNSKLKGKSFLKQKPVFVYEEKPGFPRYVIPDFICLAEKLIIEIDGSIHDIPEIVSLDQYKQNLLENRGYRTLRFTNYEVENNIDSVLNTIAASFLGEQRKELR